MMIKNMEQLEFRIDTQRILKLLANDIYDSPYALLRENVQNAFDAILMRLQKESFEPRIDITIKDGIITISDNGIGMMAGTIENNYWKAGSSGKNNPEARKAGVVGTFGIGAMANFGICTNITIVTRYYEGETTYISKAEREKLEVGKKCIELEPTETRNTPGTTVFATLEQGVNVNESDAITYLKQFVKYVEVPVYLNKALISKEQYYNTQKLAVYKETQNHISNPSGYSYDINIYISNSDGRVCTYIYNIYKGEEKLIGDVYLEQKYGGPIQGLRRGFGLASLPVATVYDLGGVANLSFLVPTAGRDSINVESVDIAGRLISDAERVITETLASMDICDHNTNFLNYVYRYGRYDLAGNIRIHVSGGDEYIKLGTVAPVINDKKIYSYAGKDKSLIGQFTSENTKLLLLSDDYPRRNIQNNMLQRKGIEPVSDSATVLKTFTAEEIETSEFAFLLRMTSFLRDDYLISDAKTYFATLSHGVSCIVKKESANLNIYIARGSENVEKVLKIYEAEPRLFDGFVKDYIRNYVYQQVAEYVPSSKRVGADALFKILQKNKELYTIEKYEHGEIEGLMKEYILGKRELSDVIRASEDIQKTHQQTVKNNQVGKVEQELADVVATNTVTSETPKHDPGIASPPIRILDNNTEMKILKTDNYYPNLNGFTHFLALSDRVFDSQLDFFLSPHTTKVIWGMHKIVYIFTHASNMLSLYYEIELKHKLSEKTTGGTPLTTTTIISKNRVFVPIVPELTSYFDFKEEKLSFYVRYDLISDISEKEE